MKYEYKVLHESNYKILESDLNLWGVQTLWMGLC